MFKIEVQMHMLEGQKTAYGLVASGALSLGTFIKIEILHFIKTLVAVPN